MLTDTLAVTASVPGGESGGLIPGLMELFKKTLSDPESLNVKVWTIRSLGKLAEYIEVGEDAAIVSSNSLKRC